MDYEGIYYEARKVTLLGGHRALDILARGSICATITKRFDSAIKKLDAAKTPKEIDNILEWLAGHLAN